MASKKRRLRDSLAVSVAGGVGFSQCSSRFGGRLWRGSLGGSIGAVRAWILLLQSVHNSSKPASRSVPSVSSSIAAPRRTSPQFIPGRCSAFANSSHGRNIRTQSISANTVSYWRRWRRYPLTLWRTSGEADTSASTSSRVRIIPSYSSRNLTTAWHLTVHLVGHSESSLRGVTRCESSPSSLACRFSSLRCSSKVFSFCGFQDAYHISHRVQSVGYLRDFLGFFDKGKVEGMVRIVYMYKH